MSCEYNQDNVNLILPMIFRGICIIASEIVALLLAPVLSGQVAGMGHRPRNRSQIISGTPESQFLVIQYYDSLLLTQSLFGSIRMPGLADMDGVSSAEVNPPFVSNPWLMIGCR